jgi:hypothetical protein
MSSLRLYQPASAGSDLAGYLGSNFSVKKACFRAHASGMCIGMCIGSGLGGDNVFVHVAFERDAALQVILHRRARGSYNDLLHH